MEQEAAAFGVRAAAFQQSLRELSDLAERQERMRQEAAVRAQQRVDDATETRARQDAIEHLLSALAATPDDPARSPALMAQLAARYAEPGTGSPS